MSSLDRIRQAFPELANASDSEVLSEVSRRTGAPTSQLADTLGIKPSGTMYETGRQIAAGLVVDAPEMLGQAAKYYSQPGGQRANEGPFRRLGQATGLERQYGVDVTAPDALYTAGQSLVDSARARAPEWAPDMRGRGLVGQAMVLGGRGVGAMLPTLATMALPGGQVAAPALQAALFGGSSAQDTYEKLIEQGVSEEEASAAARRVWGIQGVGEAIATAGLGAAFRPALAAVRGAPTTAKVAAAATDASVLRPLAKGLVLNTALQAGTEAGQDVGTSMVERAYGAAPEDLGEIAKQSALGGAGMSLLLGPLALGGSVQRARRAASLKEALYGENTPPELRAKAMDLVMSEARRQGVAEQDVGAWFDEQLMAEDARTEALRAAELERKAQQVNLLGESAQRLEGLQGGPFSSLEQQRAFEQGLGNVPQGGMFSSLEQQQGFEQGLINARDANIARVGQQYQDLTASNASTLMQAQDLGEQAQELLGTQQQGLESAQRVGEQWQELRAAQTRTAMDIEDMGREWQKLAAELPQPVTGELTRAQKAALRGPEGKRLKKTSEPIAPVAGGPMATSLLQPPQAAPSSQLPTPTPAPFSQLTERPSEPVVSPVSGAPAVSPAAQPAAGDSLQAPMTPQEQQQLDKLLSDASEATVGDVLPASVTGAERVRAPGKVTLTTPQLRGIRDALLKGKETGDAATQRIADALGTFADAYHAYLNAGRNVRREIGRMETLKKPRAIDTDTKVGEVDALAANAQAALAELGDAVGGNAKNVEAAVRLVKDLVQGKIVTPGSTRGATIEKLRKLDTRLSMAWNAAKQETFMGAQPDTAATNPSPVRNSREVDEKGLAIPTLVEAAGGYVSMGAQNAADKAKRDNAKKAAAGEEVTAEEKAKETPAKITGVEAILQRIIDHSTTPYESVLATALRETLLGQRNPVTVKFIESGTPSFDPNTNTVSLLTTQSTDVQLHELFHAALQAFVYRNWDKKDPAIESLRKSLKAVTGYKAPLTGKAKEVQDLLKKLVAGKNEKDAVLELISYGNTLNEFRRAMQAMPSKGVPQSFRETISNLWGNIKRVASRMLGVKPSLASDVLDASMDLLERSRRGYAPAAGQVLEAAVQTSKPLSDAKAAAALGIPEQDYTRWAGSNLINMLPFQRMFESVGWSEANARKFVGAAGTKFKDYISKNFPGTEIVLGLINSRYAVSASVSKLMDRFKLDKGIGYQYAEDLANVVSRRPADEVNAVFAYLDGDAKALDKYPDALKLKAVADKLKEWFKLYVAELSPVEQRYFNTRKFTETLLFPKRTEQVAGGTFGLGKINRVLGLERKTETELDKDWFAKDENGDLLLDGDMYQVFKTANTVKPGVPEPAGFMSAARFAELNGQNPMGYSVDTTRKWLHEGASDQGHKFITNTTAKAKIADQKADDVANALRNTIAALANNYASKQFIKSVYGMGRGDSAHAQVAFDSLADINKAFGTSVTDDKVLRSSEELSRSPMIRDLYRQTGTWVKLPKSDVFGELSDKYIPGPVWNAMIDMSDRQPLIPIRAANTTMRWFKKSKTVWNPGTHVTNAASNVTMAMLHDISFGTMSDAAKLLAKYEAAPKSLNTAELQLIMAFRDSGAMLADYSSAEVKEALYQAHAKNLRGGEDLSVARRVAGWLDIEKSKAEWLKAQAAKVGKGVNRLDDITTQMYAAEDNIFRLAAFLKTAGTLQRQAGLKAPTAAMMQQAGEFARQAFGDYDIDSKAVKIARQTVLPFVSWFYAMAPVLGRIAVYQPWKMVNVLAAYSIIEAAMSAAGGGDDEELRKQGPESLRERMFFGTIGPYMHVRIPFMGDDQNPVYYKLGDYFPMASMTKGLPNGVAGQSWYPSGLTPSGPFVSGLAGMVLGVDPYTGKSIHQPTDTDWQKLVNTAKFGYDIAMPPAVNSKQISKAMDIANDKTGITGVKPSLLPVARSFGLKLYDFNVDEQAAINDMNVKRIRKEFKAAMTKAQREEMRKGTPDYEALDAELLTLQERMDKAIEKARGGAED